MEQKQWLFSTISEVAKDSPHRPTEETGNKNSWNSFEESHFVHNEVREKLVLTMDVSQGQRVAVRVVGVDAESGEEESAVEQQEAGAIHVHQSRGWKRKRVREKPKNMSVQYKMNHKFGIFSVWVPLDF